LPRRLIVFLIAAFALVPAASAHAGWMPPVVLDGPNAEVQEVGNVDLARDGTGGVGYIRAGRAHVVRIADGAWRAPEQVDFGPGDTTEVKVAAGDGHRLAMAWISGGTVYATVSPGGAGPGGFAPAVALGGPGAEDIDIDLGVNGAAYVVFQEAGNVIAARLQDTTWTRVAEPLDVVPAHEAGTGVMRPRVAVSAEGYAVATWGERTADGLSHLIGRRITGLNLSRFPQDLTLPGGNADSPDIDIEDDGSFAWIVFRQDQGPVSRTVGRRLIGSLYEAPEFIDGGVPSAEPAVDMSGAGRGHSVSGTGNMIMGSWLDHDHFQPAARLDGIDGVSTNGPVVATGDRNDIAAAWRVTSPDGNAIARARFKSDGEPFGGELTVSRPDLGPVADPGVFIGGDRVGDFAVAMVQGSPGARALTVAVYDRPPTAPFIESSQTYKRKTRPELRWRPGLELWGAQTYRVYVDGAQIGQTQNTRLVPSTPLTTGKHTWQVEAVDRAGQVTRSRLRTLRIDATKPTLKVSVTGRRVAGAGLKIRVRVSDRGGSKLDHITVNYGDKSRTSRSRSTVHRYKRGTYRLRVAAVDKAGNVARKEVRLRIKAS
jgi:hypothetical protein